MFNEETVFILGAGASWHYGCPTGEDLVNEIRKKADKLVIDWKRAEAEDNLTKYIPNYFKKLDNNPKQARDNFIKECELIQNKLRWINPLSIDLFLETNPDLQNIGKLLIGLVLLECETEYEMHKGNLNRKTQLISFPDIENQKRGHVIDVKKCKDDWCRFIVHEMVSGCSQSCDLLNNKVSFITFNYDVTLENRIYQAISQIGYFNNEDKRKFFTRENFVFHVYGQLRNPSFENKLFGTFPRHEDLNYENMVKGLNLAWEAAGKLKTIIESERDSDSSIIEEAKKKLKSAAQIFVLGYGFDSTNNQLLQLNETLRWSREWAIKVCFTNFNNSNRINKHADAVFLKGSGSESFVDKNLIMPNLIRWKPCYEKSIRNVYEALELDFDFL